MAATNANFKAGPADDVEVKQDNSVDYFKEEPLDSDGVPMDIDSLSGSSHSRHSSVPSLEHSLLQYATPTTPSNSPSPMQRPKLPARVTPILLSSSDTSNQQLRRRPGSTLVHRKTTSSHAMIAKATRAVGNAMTCEIKEMAQSSKEVKTSKITMQLNLFSQQMEYQRDRDQRLYEASRLANDNAKLSIVKQGELVTCLSELSTALTTGFQVRHAMRRASRVPIHCAPTADTPRPPNEDSEGDAATNLPMDSAIIEDYVKETH